jgi:hypothetical protein
MLLLASALGAQQPTLGRVEGVARAGAEGRSARDVSITLTRLAPEPVTTRTTATDSLARYRIESLAESRYLLEVSSPLLDSLQLAIGAREVRVVAGETTRADVALPSDAAVRATLAEAEQVPTTESVDTRGTSLSCLAEMPGRAHRGFHAHRKLPVRGNGPSPPVAGSLVQPDLLPEACGPTGDITEEGAWPQYHAGCLSGHISTYRSARRASSSANGGRATRLHGSASGTGIRGSRRPATRRSQRFRFV